MSGALTGGTTISNSSSTTSSNFITPTGSSNSIGTVILSNGRVSGTFARTIGSATTLAGPFAAFNGDQSSGTGNLSQIELQYNIGGGYTHYIGSRHYGIAGATSGNAIDFYIFSNATGTAGSSTAPNSGNVRMMSVTGAGVGIYTTYPNYMLDVFGTINLGSPQGVNGNISLRYNNIQNLSAYTTSATINPTQIPNVIDVGTTTASSYSATPSNTTNANTTTNPNASFTMGHCFNRIRAVGGFLSYTVAAYYNGQNYNVHWYLPWTTYQIAISSVGMTGTNTIVNYSHHLTAISGTTGTGLVAGAGVIAALGSAPNWGYYSYGVWQVPNGSTANQVFMTTITIISPAMAMYNGSFYGVV
jgi:hypothetical protein